MSESHGGAQAPPENIVFRHPVIAAEAHLIVELRRQFELTEVEFGRERSSGRTHQFRVQTKSLAMAVDQNLRLEEISKKNNIPGATPASAWITPCS